MQAVLLAAGKSSRFYPYNTDIEHKSLVTMMGKTLIEHTVDALQKCGVTNIVIITGKNSSIPGIFSKNCYGNITCIEQPQPLGMGDAILKVKDFLDESFFVLSAYHMDIVDFIDDMKSIQKGEEAVVLVKNDDVLERYGNVALDGNRVVDIVEKPEKAFNQKVRLVAIYLLTKNFINELENFPTEEYHFEKALAAFAHKGHVVAVTAERPTVTLKYAWDLLGIKEYLLSKISVPYISTSASIAKDAVIIGNVVVEDGAIILEGACIKGPAYIGKYVTIGNRAIVRNGVIVEENSVIGSQMEMKNTFVMQHTTTHAGFIGDSVIGHDTKIAGGIITANARLDRQYVFATINKEKVNTGKRHIGVIIGSNDNIGIRAAIMPGIIIGNNVIIGPTTTIMKNIEDNKKYYTKFSEVIEENNEK